MKKRPHHYYTQSGVVPYRRGGGSLRVLLITSSRGRHWIIPKGVVEPGLTPAASAEKEAREEAGAVGKVKRTSLGRYRYEKWGGTCEVEVFPMRVARLFEDWEESHRDREWVSVREAAARVEEPGLRKVLKRLAKTVRKA